MAWIESHQELGSHPKTRKLARLLGISRPTVVGHLQFLWWWATDYAQDGDLSRFDRLDIALGAEWEGDHDPFVAALITAGFLDEEDDHLVIHDWDDYAGKLIMRREAGRAANAERQRRFRDRHRDESVASINLDDRNALRNDDVTQSNGPTVPNRTEQNRTSSPPTPPKGGTEQQQQISPSTYVEVIGTALPTVAGQYAGIHTQFTEAWFRQALAKAAAQVGPLPRDRLGLGLELAADQIQRDINDGSINNPRALAQSRIVTYLKEQRDGIPAQNGTVNGVRSGPAEAGTARHRR